MNEPVISVSTQLNQPMQSWLGFEPCEGKNLFRLRFTEQHIGNPMIRSVHGGVSASGIEMAAQIALQQHLDDDDIGICLVSSSIDYLRVTRDVDIFARAQIVRVSRRLAFIDVWCWQDEEETPIARGTCTLRIMRQSEE